MLARWLLLSLMLSSCVCTRHRHPRAPRTVEVRWPATAPVELVKEPDRPPDEVPPQSIPGVQVRAFEDDGLQVLEVILGEADFDDPLPMVVLLHGRGDRPRVPGGPFSRAPTAMRLILPRAPTPLGNGFTWLPVSITEGRVAQLASSLEERAAQLAALVNRLRNDRPTLGLPIVAGFSQGAMLSFTLALQYPQLFSVALPAAGWVPPSLMPEVAPAGRRVRIRGLHGTADPIVPIEPTLQVVARLRELAWDIELDSFEGVEHTLTQEMNARFEEWLEEALREQAPRLGGGLGEAGEESQAYLPVEPLDPQTIEALQEATPLPAQDVDARQEDGEPRPDGDDGDFDGAFDLEDTDAGL